MPPAPGGGGGCEEDEAATLTSGDFLGGLVFAIASGLDEAAVASGFFGLAVAIGAGLA